MELGSGGNCFSEILEVNEVLKQEADEADSLLG